MNFISRCPIYSGCKFNTEINHAYVGFVDWSLIYIINTGQDSIEFVIFNVIYDSTYFILTCTFFAVYEVKDTTPGQYTIQ